jgi:hypothetical protein
MLLQLTVGIQLQGEKDYSMMETGIQIKGLKESNILREFGKNQQQP